MSKLVLISSLNRILKNEMFKSSSLYLFSSFLNSAIPFLLLPILTRYLSSEDYGIVAMFMVMVSFIYPFTGLSVGSSIYKQYLDLDKKNLGEYIFNVFVLLVLSSLIISIAFFFFEDLIFDLTNLTGIWIYSVILIASMNFIISILLSLWQLKSKPIYFGIFQNSNTLVNSSLSILLVIVFGLSWQGRLYGIIFGSTIFGVIAIYFLYKEGYIQMRFDRNHIRNALTFGVPMIPTIMKDAVISISDKIFLTSMIGLSSTGLFAVGLQFSIPIALLTTAINSSYVPVLFEKLKMQDLLTNIRIVKFTYLYFLLILLIALAWSLVGSWLLLYVVGESFLASKQYIFWLSMGFAFSGMHSMVVNYIYYAQKTTKYGLMSIGNIFLNIVLNYFLIKNYGSIGAAQATCFTFFIFFLATWWLSNKVYPMPWAINFNKKLI